jgi:hypothetical protein
MRSDYTTIAKLIRRAANKVNDRRVCSEIARPRGAADDADGSRSDDRIIVVCIAIKSEVRFLRLQALRRSSAPFGLAFKSIQQLRHSRST